MTIVIEISVALILLAAVLVRGLRFAPSRVTNFELQRQAEQDDQQAKAELQLRRVRTELLALRQIVELLCIAAITLLLVSLLAAWQALLGAIIALLLIELLGNTKVIERLAKKITSTYLPTMLRLTKAWHPLLKALADHHHDNGHIATFYSKDELLHMIEHDRGILHPDEQTTLQRALTYRHLKVKDVMLPKASVTAIDKNDELGPLLLDKLHKSAQQYFPVINRSLNNVLGIIDMADLLPLRADAKKPTDVMSPHVMYLAESTPLDQALTACLQTGAHLFIVINELEEITGVISLQTILQQVVGKRQSEFDQYEDRRAVITAATASRHRS